MNRTLILDETNSKIKRKKPSDYVEEMIQKHGSEEQVKSLLKEHFISESAYERLLNDEFDNFVIEREKEIKRHVIENIGIEERYPGETLID